jgi:pimeloyl-ACP methyl ester carboxylesterase
MKTRIATGVELAYDLFGDEADEAVLLISGLGAQRIRWTAPFCEDLAARGFRVVDRPERPTEALAR